MAQDFAQEFIQAFSQGRQLRQQQERTALDQERAKLEKEMLQHRVREMSLKEKADAYKLKLENAEIQYKMQQGTPAPPQTAAQAGAPPLPEDAAGPSPEQVQVPGQHPMVQFPTPEGGSFGARPQTAQDLLQQQVAALQAQIPILAATESAKATARGRAEQPFVMEEIAARGKETRKTDAARPRTDPTLFGNRIIQTGEGFQIVNPRMIDPATGQAYVSGPLQNPGGGAVQPKPTDTALAATGQLADMIQSVDILEKSWDSVAPKLGILKGAGPRAAVGQYLGTDKELVAVRNEMKRLYDLVYVKSGKQINENEQRILKSYLVDVNQDADIAKMNLDRFKQTLQAIAEARRLGRYMDGSMLEKLGTSGGKTIKPIKTPLDTLYDKYK